jgi:polar amino acid transport system substrate-binding protein
MVFSRPFTFLLVVAFLSPLSTMRCVGAEEALRPNPGASSSEFRVAVSELPPFVSKDKSGGWSGLSIEIWEQIAAKLGIRFRYVELPLEEILRQLRRGECDLSPVMALSGNLADVIDFTEPYLFSHGAVFVARKSLLQTVGSFRGILWNKRVMVILGGMLLGMMVFSLLLILAEEKHQRGHFSGTLIRRIGSALWFSAVTMTTVGYGDKTPLSPLGRLISFFWMLVGVLLIALFTGTIASDITRAETKDEVARFADLVRFRVGCIEGGRMDFLLDAAGIMASRFRTSEEAMGGFRSGTINAFAGDAVSLQYLMNRHDLGALEVFNLPDSALLYAFATKPGLPQLGAINRELLKITLAPGWRSKAEHWTGPLNL